MASSKPWHILYGAALVGLIAAGVVATVTDLSAYFQNALQGLKVGFSAVLLIQLGIFLLLSILERVLPPAGPRKPLKGYLLNVSVQFLERVVGPVLAGITGACTAALGQRLGLGWNILRPESTVKRKCRVLSPPWRYPSGSGGRCSALGSLTGA
jgi:hypothetical protein